MKKSFTFVACLFSFGCLISNSSADKIAMITGITGQDGPYLAELLLDKGYEVHGLSRGATELRGKKIRKRLIDSGKFYRHYGDITNFSEMVDLVNKIKPTEIYNLASQSHVGMSFESPHSTYLASGLGPLNLLEALRSSGIKSKFFQASSAEVFGLCDNFAKNEQSVFRPRSPYGVAKLYAHWLTVNYRESYGIFACSGFLFGHESPLRGNTFVTKKIVSSAVRITKGLEECLYLGNLNAKRDWGYAKDYVEAMWLILQHDKPDDWVVATGKAYSIREFVELVFNRLGIKITWQGSGLDEVGVDKATGKVLVRIDKKFFRPVEVSVLRGDASKAKKILGWEPKTSLNELVAIMIEDELKGFELSL